MFLHDMKPNRRTLALTAVFAAAVQFVVISYNGATGYVHIPGAGAFLQRWLVGTAFSLPPALLMLVLDLALIRLLEKRLRWHDGFLLRATGDLLFAALLGAALGTCITGVVHALSPYRDGLGWILANNALIAALLNIFFLTALEGATAWFRAQDERRKAEALERENARIRFETLKAQLNPHFLFNSLNILSSLINSDAKKAQHFVDEFARVTRYTLDVIDEPLVELSRELMHARSYLELLGIRFGGAFSTDTRIGERQLRLLIPPLSLQGVLENIFKHNSFSEADPLHVDVRADSDTLVVTNALRRKHGELRSTGIGLKNLRARYALIADREPSFAIEGDFFVARLPLLEAM